MTGLVTAIVLSYNEEQNIKYCLENIKNQDMPIFVVDSGSTDKTVEIAKAYDCRIFRNPYENHAKQWEWALRNLPIQTPWVLALDADFVVSEALVLRMQQELPNVAADVAGIYIRHKYIFGGGVIRFGGTKRHWMRLIRHGRAWPDHGDLVDFRFVVDGRTIRWAEHVTEYNRKDDDISVWILKQDKFALRLAVEEELRRMGRHGWSGRVSLLGNTDQRYAWLRDRWLALPMFWRPIFYWLYRYIIMGGFLDGRAGFLYHTLQGLWLRVLVDVKISELRSVGLKGDELEAVASAMLVTRSGSVRDVLRVLREKEQDPGGNNDDSRDVAACLV